MRLNEFFGRHGRLLVPRHFGPAHEVGRVEAAWFLQKFESDRCRIRGGTPFFADFVGFNLLLNEGIAVFLDKLIGAAGTVFSNANAYIGVGDSATAAAATQTALQAASNKAYVAMDATYPSRAAQTMTWRSTFNGSTGNFAWNEFTIANGNSDAAENLNRLVSAQGTKTSGQSWIPSCTLTLS